MAYQVAAVVGSLRKESYSRKIAKELQRMAPPELKIEIVEIGRLPLYNQDLDESPPAEWQEFRSKIKASDAVIFVTPEYNRSVPGVLKNALDVGSRPYGSSAWQGKPGAVVSVSPGALAAFGANHHLRQSLVFLDVPVLQQPEMYLGNVTKVLSEDGKVHDPKTEEFLKQFLNNFKQWIDKNISGGGR